MLFNRKVEVSIVYFSIDSTGEVVESTSPRDKITFKEQRIKFSIKNSFLDDYSTGQISIYNLSAKTKEFLNTSYYGLKVNLEVGYQNTELENIISGTVSNIIDIRQGVDTITTLYIRDGSLLSNKNLKNDYTFRSEGTISEYLDHIQKGNALKNFNYLGNAKQKLDSDKKVIKFANYGKMKAVFADLLGANYKASFTHDRVTIRYIGAEGSSENQSEIERPLGTYSYKTGLLSVPSLTYFSASFDHLLRAEFKPGELILINPLTVQVKFNSLIYEDTKAAVDVNSTFRIMEVMQVGDNRADSWVSTITSYVLQ